MGALSPLLTGAEVAELLCLNPRTLYKPAWQRRVCLVPIRVGRAVRFRREDVERLLSSQRDPLGRDDLRRWAQRNGLAWPDEPMEPR